MNWLNKINTPLYIVFHLDEHFTSTNRFNNVCTICQFSKCFFAEEKHTFKDVKIYKVQSWIKCKTFSKLKIQCYSTIESLCIKESCLLTNYFTCYLLFKRKELYIMSYARATHLNNIWLFTSKITLPSSCTRFVMRVCIYECIIDVTYGI